MARVTYSCTKGNYSYIDFEKSYYEVLAENKALERLLEIEKQQSQNKITELTFNNIKLGTEIINLKSNVKHEESNDEDNVLTISLSAIGLLTLIFVIIYGLYSISIYIL